MYIYLKIENGNIKSKLLKLAHQNLGSGKLVHKITDIDYIKHLHNPDILGISETKVDDNTIAQLKVRGFKTEVKHDTDRINVLIKDTISYKRRYDLEIDNFPGIWLDNQGEL